MSKRYVVARRFLIFWTLFIGIGAVAGASGMLIDKSGKSMGMDAMLPYFQVLPFAEVLFQNFIFSGIALLIVNGITNLLAAVLLFMRKKTGIVLGMVFGVTLMLWICIQFYIFPFNFMSTAYFIFGFLQFVTGYVCLVGYKQSKFKFNKDDYKNIGKCGKEIVVFFSRTGYTKKLAYEIANESGAEIFEVKTKEKIDGDLGFWWCGRFGMNKKLSMPLISNDIDFTKYEKVTLCSPVWVFKLCAPMREFCKIHSGKISNANYVITHFINGKLNGVADEIDKLLNIKRSGFKSYVCRFGEHKELKGR